MSVALSSVRSTLIALSAAALLAGCGGTAPSEPVRQAPGSIHAVVQSPSGASRVLAVDYAAAGLAAPTSEDGGSLVIVGVFRDGRVDEGLDLQTLSISVPLAELPGQSGSLDVLVDGAALAVLLEGSHDVVLPDQVKGSIHLRYDAPPRPGITLRGDFSLTITTATHGTLKLDGELEVPILGG